MTGQVKSRDYRLVSVALFGLSGLYVLFTAVIKTSLAVAMLCSALAVVAGLLIAAKALRPWQGTARDQRILLAFSVLQLVTVATLVALLT